MSEIKRYDLVGDMDGNCNLNEARMELSDDGVYVKHSDYAALEAKCAALAAEKEKFTVECAAAKIAIAYLKSGRQDFSLNTPATDAFLSEVRAQGVEMFGQYHNFSEKLFIQEEAQKFASKLRKGGEQK